MWMALAIGNSRFHWAILAGNEIKHTWHSDYFAPSQTWRTMALQQSSLGIDIEQDCPLIIASVVPVQTRYWQLYAQQIISLADIPLTGLYPTLGIDRALVGYGAGQAAGYPVMVVDSGTALTVTGINADQQLVGGAIWPGLRLQLQSLQQGTAGLAGFLPDWRSENRWAQDTSGAITSGILHNTVAGVIDFWQDWQQQFPRSQLFLTGGDGKILSALISSRLDGVKYSPDLIFQGMAGVYTLDKK
jgi:type III pantothenate kinase